MPRTSTTSWVTADPGHNKTKRGGVCYPSYDDPNPARLQVQAINTTDPFPMANVGDELTGVTEGPLDYSQFAGAYNLEARKLGTYDVAAPTAADLPALLRDGLQRRELGRFFEWHTVDL
ncbi:hypothetical protein [Streptomyces atratus]|uniref:hypothetical protein n=1 Tax=Streptomyces atratus TaxID=1893 RepID=UPI0033C7B17F